MQSPAELNHAVDRDTVVRDHYQGIYLGQVTKTHLDKDMLAYVSYRVKNKIYWTQKKVHLHKGELVLTDGEHMVRGRCGNRISTSPVISGAGPEPPESQLDTEEPKDNRLAVATPPVTSTPGAKDSTPGSAFAPPVPQKKAVPTVEKASSRRLFPVLVPIAMLAGSSIAAGHSNTNSGVTGVNVPASGGSGSNIAPLPHPPSGPPARVPVSAPPPSSGPPITVAPEPSAYLGLLGVGLGWLVVRSRRRRVRN